MSNQPIQTRKLSFQGYAGDQLAANLDFPSGQQPSCYLLISHCFTCTRHTLTTARLSRGLAEAGFAVLRFDFTGLGESQGEFADSHFSSMVGDIEQAAAFLAAHFEAPQALLGHSLGGTASLAASQNGHSALSAIKKLVTLASPAAPDHVLHHFGEAALSVLGQGNESSIEVAGQDYPIKPGFIEDVRNYDMAAQMHHCQLPILAVRAGKDALVGPQDAEQILAYNPAQSHLLDIAGADHLFSERQHTAELIAVLSRWLV